MIVRQNHQPSNERSTAQYGHIDLTDVDDDKIPTFNLVGLDDDEDLIEVIREVTPERRNPRTANNKTRRLDTYEIGPGEIIKPGVVVELIDSDFLRVASILQLSLIHI